MRSSQMQPWIETLHRTALSSRAFPTPLRYALTIVVVVVVTVAQSRLGNGDVHHAFLPFVAIVFACGTLLNRGNGFLATLLSAALATFFLVPPEHSLSIDHGRDRVALFFFVVIGLSISVIVEALHVGLVELAEEHERVRLAAKDRNLLINELGHRTRNDFANVVTLLRMQARSAGDEAREAINGAADRVLSIAQVHRQLSLVGDRVVIDAGAYIKELCISLQAGALAMRPIALQCDVESHLLGHEKVVPLGLILNESITNAIKHAFPDNRQGKIVVSFRQVNDGYELKVQDDGVGVADADARDGALGSRLMRMLAAQLGGSLEVVPLSPGTAVIATIVRKFDSNVHKPD